MNILSKLAVIGAFIGFGTAMTSCNSDDDNKQKQEIQKAMTEANGSISIFAASMDSVNKAQRADKTLSRQEKAAQKAAVYTKGVDELIKRSPQLQVEIVESNSPYFGQEIVNVSVPIDGKKTSLRRITY